MLKAPVSSEMWVHPTAIVVLPPPWWGLVKSLWWATPLCVDSKSLVGRLSEVFYRAGGAVCVVLALQFSLHLCYSSARGLTGLFWSMGSGGRLTFC